MNQKATPAAPAAGQRPVVALSLTSWTSANHPPDDDTLVLLEFVDGEVWPGFRDGDVWRYMTAEPIEPGRVVHWAPLPAGPVAAPAGSTDAMLDSERFAKLLQICTDARASFGPNNEIRAVTMKFKNSVETSTGYRSQLRKLVDDIKPMSMAPEPAAASAMRMPTQGATA